MENNHWGWVDSSMIECLLRTRQVLGSIPSTASKKAKKKKLLMVMPGGISFILA